MPEGPGPARVRSVGSTRDATREHFATQARNAEKIQKYNLGLTDDDELPPYVHQEYPKAMYAANGESIVVQDAKEEHQQLSDGYYSSLVEAQEAAAHIGDGEEAEEETAEEPSPNERAPAHAAKRRPHPRKR